MQPLKVVTVALFVLFLSACQAPHGQDPVAAEPMRPGADQPPITYCNSEERPEMCTRDYRPVCALVDTGVRCITKPCPSTRRQTMGNACSACADERVIGFIEGECSAGAISSAQ